jgi:hypothetical protein
MGRPQWDLFETSQDALDDRLDLQPQMGAGPPEESTGSLQIGGMVREEVPPRRRWRITLIESCQGPSDSTHRSGGVAVPKKDLVQWRPGCFFLEQGPEATQIG